MSTAAAVATDDISSNFASLASGGDIDAMAAGLLPYHYGLAKQMFSANPQNTRILAISYNNSIMKALAYNYNILIFSPSQVLLLMRRALAYISALRPV